MTATGTIPSFDGWSANRIQNWIETNPANTQGVEQAQVVLASMTTGDVKGAASAQEMRAGSITLPAPSNDIDLKGAGDIMAKFEELLILFQLMAAENKKFTRQDANALLEKAADKLLQAADKKDEGAEKMLSMAIVALVVTVVGAAVSIALAPLAAVTGGATQGAQKAATEAAKKATTEVIKNTLNAIKTSIIKTVKQGVKHTLKALLKTIAQAASKSASYAAKGTTKVMSNPQACMGVFQGVSQSMSALGQSKSMIAQAEGDRYQAQATETQAHQKKAEERVGDFREAMKKMNDLIRTLYDAKMKSEEAAAKA
ncbi:type III secretion system translocon subunit SctB [Halodesulfovibrio sp.]|uniref:type III secretion system translocon subunit SctB n=1 Tax=Halodesulfovibrio sp. TaxID=1912772 RepID=UPI0025BF39A5|nr:type III secretion system translocon subunit SctB [Halodesulfovibrio sp.]